MKNVLIGILLTVSLVGCNKAAEESVIYGTWIGEFSGIKTCYVFNVDGTYQYYEVKEMSNNGKYIYSPTDKMIYMTDSQNWTFSAEVRLDSKEMLLFPKTENRNEIGIKYTKIIP